MEEIIERINKIKEIEENYNQEFPLPIDSNNIESFIEKFKAYFSVEDVDEGFINFLKICDGLDFNGYQIYSSYDHTINGVEYGIFQNNKLWYEDEENKDFIFYAESGSDLYVFNKQNNTYELQDRYSRDVFKSYKSFGEMLLYILKLMLYEEVE